MSRAYQNRLSTSTLPRGAAQLRVENLGLRFGGVQALLDVSLTVRQGTIHAIIGPNGAGKTSLLNCASALYHPQAGRIVLVTGKGEHVLTSTRPTGIARLGVARTFQNIELFRHMSVLDNLMLGRHIHMKHRVFPSFLWFGRTRQQEIEHRTLVEEVLDLLEIQAVRKKPVGSLAYGVQKRVELGRALCMQPQLLLLDEPMAGMNSEEKEDMARFILDVAEQAGVTLVLIEHDMGVVMDISDHVTVLDFGRVIGDGTPDEVSRNDEVIQAYLGTGQRA